MKTFTKVFAVISFLAIIVGAFLCYTGVISFRKFPEAKGAKQITLNCNYKGKKVVVTESLYQSIDDFYSSDPKKRSYTALDNYKGFSSSYPEDSTITDLVQKINSKGKAMHLSKDETMDLATCFVQNIPYDKEKGKVVLSQGEGTSVSSLDSKAMLGRFPYETLYDNEGICTDKSYLEAAVLEKMGYGTAILTFDKERHMAVGVETPADYSLYDGRYSYLETTNVGYNVGQIPEIDNQVGSAKSSSIEKVSKKEEGRYWIPDIPEPNMSTPQVTALYDGNVYMRIVDTTKKLKRMKELVKIINLKSNKLFAYQDKLTKMKEASDPLVQSYEEYANELQIAENRYKQKPTSTNFSKYQNVYAEYKRRYKAATSAISAYNSSLSNYNTMVQNFNALIGEYNSLNKNIW